MFYPYILRSIGSYTYVLKKTQDFALAPTSLLKKVKISSCPLQLFIEESVLTKMLEKSEVEERINALVKRVDLNGDGMIDTMEGGIFIGAAMSLDGLGADGKKALAKFTADQMVEAHKPIPKTDLVEVVVAMMASSDDHLLGELEHSFELLSCDLPPPPKKVTQAVVSNKLTKLVSKIDLDGNGSIDAEELTMFLNGFVSVTNYVLEIQGTKSKYFPAEMDVPTMVAEMTKDGPIPTDDFVTRLLAMNETPAVMDEQYLKYFEMAVLQGLDEFKKPTDDKIRARIAKLTAFLDSKGNGVVDKDVTVRSMTRFYAHMLERAVMDMGDNFNEELEWLVRDGSGAKLSEIHDMIMDQVKTFGQPYLQELESALLSAAEGFVRV